jgi:hypothetical protein
MRLCRTILALLIALSVAMLPAAGGAALVAKSADMSMSESDMSMSESMSMQDCDHAVMPCHKGMDACQSMAACALKCFNFSQSGVSILRFPLVLTDRLFASAEAPAPSQPSSPPFRPPRA